MNALFQQTDYQGLATVRYLGVWGTNLGLTAGQPVFTNSRGFDIDSLNACAIESDGATTFLNCTGQSGLGVLATDWNSQYPNPVYDFYTDYDLTEVVVGDGRVCVSGAPVASEPITRCWGEENGVLYGNLLERSILYNLQLHGTLLCGIESVPNSKLVCYELTAPNASGVYTPFQDDEILHFASTATEACVVFTDGQMDCREMSGATPLGTLPPLRIGQASVFYWFH